LKIKRGANIQNFYQQYRYRLTGRTPRQITENIYKLCKELDNTQQSFFVRIKLEPEAKLSKCAQNVLSNIKKDGGQIQFGWAIWEIPDIMIEAIYHAIWISPQDDPIDITPRKHVCTDSILFLADSEDKYNYGSGFWRRDNVRRPLSDDPVIAEYIELCQEIFKFEEKVSPGPVLHLEGKDLECYEALEKRKDRLSNQIRASYASR